MNRWEGVTAWSSFQKLYPWTWRRKRYVLIKINCFLASGFSIACNSFPSSFSGPSLFLFPCFSLRLMPEWVWTDCHLHQFHCYPLWFLFDLLVSLGDHTPLMMVTAGNHTSLTRKTHGSQEREKMNLQSKRDRSLWKKTIHLLSASLLSLHVLLLFFSSSLYFLLWWSCCIFRPWWPILAATEECNLFFVRIIIIALISCYCVFSVSGPFVCSFSLITWLDLWIPFRMNHSKGHEDRQAMMTANAFSAKNGMKGIDKVHQQLTPERRPWRWWWSSSWFFSDFSFDFAPRK